MTRLARSFALQLTCCLLATLLAGGLWAASYVGEDAGHGVESLRFWAIAVTLLLPLLVYRLYRCHRQHVRKVLFLLDAIENNDYAVHFLEEETRSDAQLVNRALNRVASILNRVKSETVQQEKYYELILDCVSTGIVVLSDNGTVYQKNDEALRLLGLNVFTHICQLRQIDEHLYEVLQGCRPGEKLQAGYCNERGTVALSVRVSGIHIHEEPLRILALNDINHELDEKEIDSWVRLTRVLTHEIMNAVTPLTSLSDTLLELTAGRKQTTGEQPGNDVEEELRNGLQTISNTGKGLLAFVDSYRKFTRIPTPAPSLFYVKEFAERMVELARHQPCGHPIDYRVEVVPDDLILYADENLIAQVVINLLKNAQQAIGQQERTSDNPGHVRLRAYCDEQEAVWIEISNDGPLIPPEIADHIFIPFFSTKEGGSGIGLSISRQIMRLSNGSLALKPGKETCFVLKFE